jgi:iron complex outermembrane receptor protein
MLRIRSVSALLLACALVTSPLAALSQTRTAAAVASFGLSVVANPASGAGTLTRQQVADIFSGRITNWKQVGGADQAIVVVTRGAGTAAETTFEKVYLGGTRLAVAGMDRATPSDAAAAVAGTNGAVSFLYDADAKAAVGVQIIAVSDVRPTDASGVVDLGSVNAAAAAGAYQGEETTASAIAPTQADLNSLGTHSTITRDFIEENSSPLAEFTRIATIAPSVSNTGAVNGPGLSEQTLIIRGMAKDFTNLTFDGIPEADTNDPSYHSTSFFPELLVGGVDVVRGPGFAHQMGYATFGGSENVSSLAPSQTPALDLAYSYGNWNTQIGSVRYQTGRQSWLGNGTLMLTYQDLGSNGYLGGNGIWSRNYSFKYERAFGEKTLLDVFGTWNDQAFNAADAGPGATLYEINVFGPNYSLNTNPRSGECACFNYQIKTTDLGYIRLRSELGWGLHVDNRVYTFRYDNETTAADTVGLTGAMVTAGTLPSQGTITCAAGSAACTAPLVGGSLAANGLVYNPTNIGGYLKRNKYIAVGDILDVTKSFGASDQNFIRGGIWLEHSSTDRHQYSVDFTTGAWNYVNGTNCLFGNPVQPGGFQVSGATPAVVAANCAANATALPAGLKQLPGPNSGALANGVPIGAVKFDQQSQILNGQPYIEAQIALPSGTTLYGGYKWAFINRYDAAQVQNTSRTPNSTNLIPYQFQLPYFSVNQRLTGSAGGDGLALYFQYGRGYEIPDLQTFYVNNPLQNATVPNLSTTYQGGFIGKSHDLAWDLNYYTVNFSNQQVALNVDAAGNLCAACAYTAYFDIGGARYWGVEGEATLNLGGGFALYGNYSTDVARELTFNSQIKGVPDMTAAAGLLFKSPRFDGSLIYKMIGHSYLNQYSGPASAANYFDPNQQIAPYGLLDVDFTWKSKHSVVQLNFYNITDSVPYTTVIATSLNSSTLMNHIAPPSMLLTYRYKLW